MERLTDSMEYCDRFCDNNKSKCPIYRNCINQQMYERLREYEDLEEQGKLLKLPCAIGDTVYCIYNKYQECDAKNEYCIQSEKAQSLDWIVEQEKNKRFGKTVFLTKSSAEQALKEMEGKNGN